MKTLSGYATTNRGVQLAFSILTNNLNAPSKKVTDAIDSIVIEMVDDGPPKK